MPIPFKHLPKLGAFLFVHFDNPSIYAYNKEV